MASIRRRPDGKWRARYRDETGREHAKHFARKVDAQRWLDGITADVLTGRYVDPGAGRITFSEYAEAWRAVQPHRPSTADKVARSLAKHVYPTIGDVPLDRLRQTHLQSMVARMDLAPSSVRVTMRYVSSVLNAAVADRRIATSPALGLRLPRPQERRVVIVPTEAVMALVEAVPGRMRAMLVLAAGTGLRQGEVFGVTLDRLDLEGASVRVDRQIVDGGVFGPPKTASSGRTVPLPDVVVNALREHLENFGTGQDGLVFTRASGRPWKRSAFSEAWVRARASLDVPEDLTMHSLRHYYASLLIRHGESVKVVQARLGHATAAETLDTYAHLWPDSEDRTRVAVDAVLGAAADQVRTNRLPRRAS